MLYALRILQQMSLGLHEGRVTTFAGLARQCRLGYDALEQLLDKLQVAQLVCKTEAQGWVMMRDAEHIRVTELLQLFALNRLALTSLPQDEPLQNWLTSSVEKMEHNTDISLQELFATAK
jgi:DNA-binding IscR family transcriptional regulator